jgi:hypothetical protein
MRRLGWCLLWFNLVVVVLVIVWLGGQLWLVRGQAPFKQVLLRVRRFEQNEGYQDDNELLSGDYHLYFLGFDERYFLTGLRPEKLKVMVLGYFDDQNQAQIVYGIMPGEYRGKRLKLRYWEKPKPKLIENGEELVRLMQAKQGRLISTGIYYAQVTDRNKQFGPGWYIEAGSPKIWRLMVEAIAGKKASILTQLVALPVANIDAERRLTPY